MKTKDSNTNSIISIAMHAKTNAKLFKKNKIKFLTKKYN